MTETNKSLEEFNGFVKLITELSNKLSVEFNITKERALDCLLYASDNGLEYNDVVDLIKNKTKIKTYEKIYDIFEEE